MHGFASSTPRLTAHPAEATAHFQVSRASRGTNGAVSSVDTPRPLSAG